MPIYEYYCPDNRTIYQFYAKTLAQGATVPPCPENPGYRMRKLVSAFAVTHAGRKEPSEAGEPGGAGEDPAEEAKMEAAMGAMEREFTDVDENDPRAMARMMRRMSELTGEKLDGEMEEVVRKLEEGADPESLEDAMGEEFEGDPEGDLPGSGTGEGGAPGPKERRHRFRARRRPIRRDPKLYDFP